MAAENIPQVSKQEFAEEVRSERLSIIWKATVVIAVASVWFLILFSASESSAIILSGLFILVGSLTCRYFLQHDQLEVAVWVYSVGLLGGLAILLANADGQVQEFSPFLALLVIYITGLMLPARALVPLLSMIFGVLVIAPWVHDGKVGMLPDTVLLSIFMCTLAGLITAQASGELYGIAEWALESYRRERATASNLFDSRQQVELSLLRQRALTIDLEKTNEQLGEAQRAAEEAKHFRGQFLANMSHELRTPLNAVIGFSETMLNFPPMYNNVELPDAYRTDLNQINNSGKHLLNIINDILDLSKIDAGRLDVDIQKVELEPIFKGVLSTAVGLVGGKPVKLQRNIPEGIPDVLGDPVRVRQVLLNLYSNAAKFTETGSITLGMKYDDDTVTISVTDTGEGVPEENIGIIFEEFRQAAAGRKKARAGAGLGLAISRQLLSMMNGEVWVESTYGKGSTFSFSLPRYKEEAVATAEPATTPEAAEVVAISEE